eukprot:3940582-Rhodomonas_salina.3
MGVDEDESWSALKDKGNAAFKAGKFAEAVEIYDKAVKALPANDREASRGSIPPSRPSRTRRCERR